MKSLLEVRTWGGRRQIPSFETDWRPRGRIRTPWKAACQPTPGHGRCPQNLLQVDAIQPFYLVPSNHSTRSNHSGLKNFNQWTSAEIMHHKLCSSRTLQMLRHILRTSAAHGLYLVRPDELQMTPLSANLIQTVVHYAYSGEFCARLSHYWHIHISYFCLIFHTKLLSRSSD